jgi:hypothetical protein
VLNSAWDDRSAMRSQENELTPITVFVEQIPEPARQKLLPIQTDIADNEIGEE